MLTNVINKTAFTVFMIEWTITAVTTAVKENEDVVGERWG